MTDFGAQRRHWHSCPRRTGSRSKAKVQTSYRCLRQGRPRHQSSDYGLHLSAQTGFRARPSRQRVNPAGHRAIAAALVAIGDTMAQILIQFADRVDLVISDAAGSA